MILYHKSNAGHESFHNIDEFRYDKKENQIVFNVSYMSEKTETISEGCVKIYDGGLVIQYYYLNNSNDPQQ
jgi:hypothetical protein